ncbi:MAG: T9SS type A sorting domain-containing protein [Flavobacteriales bacterium]|nr:T9SS type A sorting domain-containing protein [Flavobacteriales bacterium]
MKKTTLLSIFTAMFSVLGFSQTDIADARTFTLGQTVTVTGIVTSGSELGIIRYMQDASAGIACYPGTGSITFNPNRGDSITVTGTLKEFNDLLEIDPITSLTIISTSNPSPTPLVVTPAQQDETTEAELLQIDNVVFASGGSTFSGGTNYTFTASSESGEVRINSGSNLVGTLIPVAPVSVVALASQFFTTYQLLPRDVNDIILSSTLFLTSALSVSNITTTSLDIAWSTNSAATTNVKYGLTNLFELGEVNDLTANTSHSIALTGLTAATFYYIQAYSVSGTDTAFSSTKLVSTESNSTGQIIAYFNNEVDTSVSQGTYATYIADFPDTIIAYINKATTTLDICVYNNNNLNIVAAINNAFNNGVTVRYVSTLSTLNSALTSLDPGISVHKGNSVAIMHNKFMIVDRDDVNNSWVLTGSTNWTTNNLSSDYNNMILIQDQAVAKAYTIEFEEFWGGSGATPNTINSKFGADKTDNTPHEFVVGGNPLEVYFSPTDLTTSKIESAIESASASLEFALLSFTKNELGTAVKNANDAFGTVKGIMESINDQGEEYTFLTGAGVDLLSHQGVQYDMHHKYAIIDQIAPASDPFVLTGSHNWSTAAETKNDENTVFVHNADIANQYYQEFMARYCEIASCAAPVTSFTYSYAGSGVTNFTDISTNAPTTWAWDFGDGTGTSTVQNPTYTYTVLDATYNVCLIATNGLGSNTYCDSVYADTSTVTPGMGELELHTAFTVYPNPSSGQFKMAFTLNNSGSARVRVMDITARVLYNEVFTTQVGDNAITVKTDLSAGQYILELYIDGIASFLPIIIE